MGVFGTESGNVREGSGVAGVVGVDQDIALVELRGVFENRMLWFTELGEDEVTLLAARKLDAIDCGAGLNRWMVGGGEWSSEE